MNAVFKNVFTNKHRVVSSDKHLPVFIAQTYIENTVWCLSRGMCLHLNTKVQIQIIVNTLFLHAALHCKIEFATI